MLQLFCYNKGSHRRPAETDFIQGHASSDPYSTANLFAELPGFNEAEAMDACSTVPAAQRKREFIQADVNLDSRKEVRMRNFLSPLRSVVEFKVINAQNFVLYLVRAFAKQSNSRTRLKLLTKH